MPLSFTTTLSASANVVEVADVSPSIIVNSAVVAASPSKISNSASVIAAEPIVSPVVTKMPFNVSPASALCVKVISWSSPKLITAPSAKNKSDHSRADVPKAVPSDADGERAVADILTLSVPPSLKSIWSSVSAVIVALRMLDVPLSIAPNPEVIEPESNALTVVTLDNVSRDD